MTSSQKPIKPRPRKRRLADLAVLTAMGLAATALAVGLVLHVGVAFWLAATLAVLSFLCLSLLHAVLRRGERLDALAGEVERLESELSRLGVLKRPEPLAGSRGPTANDKQLAGSQPVGTKPDAAARPGTTAARADAARAEADPAAPLAPAPGAARAPASGMANGPPRGPRPVAGSTRTAPPRPGADASEAGGDAVTAPWLELPSDTPAGVHADLGKHRPVRGQSGLTTGLATDPSAVRGKWIAGETWPDLPAPERDALSEPGPGAPPSGRSPPRVAPPGAATTAPREVDVEMIQGLIKKLADEVNAVGSAESAGRTPVASEQAIDESVSALRQTADVMRAPPPTAPPIPSASAIPPRLETDVDAVLSRAERIAGGPAEPSPVGPAAWSRSAPPASAIADPPLARSTPPRSGPQRAEQPLPILPLGPAAPTSERQVQPIERPQPSLDRPAPATARPPAVSADGALAEISAAISEGRVEVLLEPILGLEDQRARHYEVAIRLVSRNGAPIDLTAGVRAGLAGSGALPLIDGLAIRRTGIVADRLDARGKAGSVFSTLSGESLAAVRFIDDFADLYQTHASASAQLVLTFAQSDVRAFGAQEWATLADMRALGFRFALRAVTDLDMDFGALTAAGFAFAKLDASVFLEGLPAPGGHLPASDICRHLAALGLALVVEAIEDEGALARIYGFGVLLGQGPLFGGPRLVKAEIATPTDTAAA
ncbi:MAG: EAL domain-containing protein [Pseudomonadota bacterium]